MEIVGILLIVLAFVIFATNSKEFIYQLLYLGVAFIFLVIASAIMLHSTASGLYSIYWLCIFVLIIFVVIMFIFLFRETFVNLLEQARLKA